MFLPHLLHLGALLTMAANNLKHTKRLGLLTSLMALVACGGGSDNSTPPTTNNLSLTITAPAGSNNVLDVGSPVRIQVSVSSNQAPVPDGTVVTFTATGGTLAPSNATTQAGVASSTLTGTATGLQTLTASMTVNNQVATASVPVYQRAAPQKLQLLVPAYFYPSASGSDWDRLASTAAAFPGLAITAILNPNNGIFSSTEPRYLAASQQMVASGGTVVGYVYTRYGNRSLAEVQANIDNYLNLYGRGLISGIFLDEMGANASTLAYYRTLYQYIKAKDANLRVLGNPGTPPISDYSAVADVLVSFEGKATEFANYDPRTNNAWLYGRTNTSVSALVHDAATCAAMQNAITLAASSRYNTGMVYATNLMFDFATRTGNPWATLPSYWDNLVRTVDAVNKGVALPTC
jgi:hypothetical protein